MRIKLNIEKTAHQNAAEYYELVKELRRKMNGTQKAIEETKKQIKKTEKQEYYDEKRNKEQVKVTRKKEWYEAFHYFFTSSGKLVIGGKNAEQNERIYSKYFKEQDLFFHADIQGGSACILKNGITANEKELEETAQFAACFSSAWKNENSSIDVYAVKKERVSTHSTGEFVQKGSFVITGKRMWFKNIELKLKMLVKEGIPIILPANYGEKTKKEIFIMIGRLEKGKVVKKLAKFFEVHPDEVQNILPSGRFKI